MNKTCTRSLMNKEMTVEEHEVRKGHAFQRPNHLRIQEQVRRDRQSGRSTVFEEQVAEKERKTCDVGVGVAKEGVVSQGGNGGRA